MLKTFLIENHTQSICLFSLKNGLFLSLLYDIDFRFCKVSDDTLEILDIWVNNSILKQEIFQKEY